jgi:hypothetical protein
MAKKDESRSSFPAEYSHLEEPVREARKQIDEIDKAIGDLRKKDGPNLDFRPPFHESTNKSASSNEAIISLYNERKAEIRAGVNDYVKSQTVSEEPKLAKNIAEVVDHKLGDNAYSHKSKKELEAENSNTRKAEDSYDYMESMHYNRMSNREDTDAAEKEKSTADSHEELTMDMMSDRFMERLNEYIGGKDNVSADDLKKELRSLDDIEPEKD